MEFTVVEGWLHLLGEWRYQLGSRVPERRGTRVSAFLCSEKGFLCGEPPTGFFICDCPAQQRSCSSCKQRQSCFHCDRCFSSRLGSWPVLVNRRGDPIF